MASDSGSTSGTGTSGSGSTSGSGNSNSTGGANSSSAGGSNASGSAAGNMNSADAVTMNCQLNGNSYVIELRSGDAGNATSLEEWVQSDMTSSGSGSGSDASGAGMATTVGNFDAMTVQVPEASLSTASVSGATCAYRTYVWGMGNASGTGNSGSNDNNAKNLLIATVYQTSGDTCDADQVMEQFLAGFQNGSGSGSTGSDSASGSGASGSGTGTTTP